MSRETIFLTYWRHILSTAMLSGHPAPKLAVVARAWRVTRDPVDGARLAIGPREPQHCTWGI